MEPLFGPEEAHVTGLVVSNPPLTIAGLAVQAVVQAELVVVTVIDDV
jgi:hypothetical protein